MKLLFLLLNLIVNANMSESSVSYGNLKMVSSDSNVTNNDTVETEQMDGLTQICPTQSEYLKWIQIVVERFLSESK